MCKGNLKFLKRNAEVTKLIFFQDHFNMSKVILHNRCHANKGELISTRFTGATGRAYLFSKVVNLNYRYVHKLFQGMYLFFAKQAVWIL